MIKHEIVNDFRDAPHLMVVVILENQPKLSEIEEVIAHVFKGRPSYKLRIGVTDIGKKIAIAAC